MSRIGAGVMSEESLGYDHNNYHLHHHLFPVLLDQSNARITQSLCGPPLSDPRKIYNYYRKYGYTIVPVINYKACEDPVLPETLRIHVLPRFHRSILLHN